MTRTMTRWLPRSCRRSPRRSSLWCGPKGLPCQLHVFPATLLHVCLKGISRSAVLPCSVGCEVAMHGILPTGIPRRWAVSKSKILSGITMGSAVPFRDVPHDGLARMGGCSAANLWGSLPNHNTGRVSTLRGVRNAMRRRGGRWRRGTPGRCWCTTRAATSR